MNRRPLPLAWRFRQQRQQGEDQTMRSAWMIAFLLPSLPLAASAQSGQTQLPGEQLFRQHGSLCHLKPSVVNNAFGPTLSKETVEGKEAAVKEFIAAGTPRMPGFQYTLEPTQVDAVIAYLKTMPAAAGQTAAAPAARP